MEHEKSIIKEALKNEVKPLLIGLRNEIKETNKRLFEMHQNGTAVTNIHMTVNGKEMPVMSMKDGYTPKRGTDYFTDADTKLFLKAATPVKGTDYFTDKEVKDFLAKCVPIKNKDYFDGADGKTPVKGKDYFTKKDIKEFLEEATPIKGVHYRDGAPGLPGAKGKDGTQISAYAVRDKLESLKGNDRLSMKAIKGLDEILKNLMLNKKSDGGASMPIGLNSDALVPTGVTAGSYTNASITVNALGLITSASSGSGGGGVTTVSVASANGFAGTVATPTTTPVITISTSVTGILKGNGTAISAATAGTDYLVPTTAFTAGSVAFGGASNQLAQDNANFFYDDTNNRLGLLTAVPTHTATIGAGGALAFYNTADQTTNYERIVGSWISNIFTLQTAAGGAGTNRAIRILGAGTQVDISSSPAFTIRRDSTSVASLFRVSSTGLIASSIVQVAATIDPIVNQTSTAGYTMLLINPTETATGSGAKLLADLQVGGSSKFKVDNTGAVTLSAMTAKSIIYAGTGGLLSQDNTNFNYDSSTRLLTIDATGTGTSLHTGPAAGTSNATVGGCGVEFVGTNNTSGGMNIVFGNKSAGTSAFTSLFIQNDLADATGTHYANIGLNSSTYNDATFGTALNVANQMGITNTDGPIVIGAFKVGTYVNIVVGGAASGNEVARFSSGATTFSITQPVATSGSPKAFLVTGAAHTTLTASTEAIQADWNFAQISQWATGAVALQRTMYFRGQTIAAVGASVFTDVITLQIDGPTQGTNATITNALALHVNGNWKYGSGVTGLRFIPNTSSGTFAAAYSTNVTPSNSNHFWRHNGATTVINATSAGNLQLQNDNNSILTIGSASVVAAKLMTVTDTVAGNAFSVLNSTTSAAANGATITMFTAGQNAAQGILVIESTTAIASTLQRALTFKKNNINADTTQEINIAYSLRDNSTSREAAALSMKYSNVGSGTQVTDFIFRTLQSGTTLTDSVKITGANLHILQAGGGLYVKEGTNATMGVATLVAGTVTVSTTKVTANSRIYLSIQSLGTVAVPTEVAVTARTAGTSFVITSANVTDTSVIAWFIVEPL
jgi:hypothetical protein